MAVRGGVVSTRKVRLPGESSWFPAASTAATWKMYEPSLRLPVVRGDEQLSNAGALAPPVG
jgi:hypothetical protein